MKTFWSILKQVADEWFEDKAPKLGAAVSFYTIFSLAPLFLIAIAVAGFIFGEEAAKGQIVSQIEQYVGQEGAKVVQTVLKNVWRDSSSIFATILSFVTLLIASTSVFVELKDSLNIIWKVELKPGGMIKSLLRERLLSFILVIGVGFIVLIFIFLSTILASLSDSIELYFEIPSTVIEFSNILLSFFMIFLLITMVYKFLPDVKLSWKDVWMGAFVTSILFVLGTTLISLYLRGSAYKSIYGAAGSLVFFLLWIYYSAQVFFLGAEFTYIYSQRFGKGIRPGKNAVKINGELKDESGKSKKAKDESKKD